MIVFKASRTTIHPREKSSRMLEASKKFRRILPKPDSGILIKNTVTMETHHQIPATPSPQSDLETSIVASPNIFISSNFDLIVDNEVEVTTTNLNYENVSKDNLLEQLCVHDVTYISYSRFRKSIDNEDDLKDEAKRNYMDEHKDHSYISKLTELELLELHYNFNIFDIKISSETSQRMISMTKHLYENEDNLIEAFL